MEVEVWEGIVDIGIAAVIRGNEVFENVEVQRIVLNRFACKNEVGGEFVFFH